MNEAENKEKKWFIIFINQIKMICNAIKDFPFVSICI